VKITYLSEGETGTWDIISGAGAHNLTKGSFAETGGKVADIVVTIDLPDGTNNLEVRTLYSGHGRLSVLRLGIWPLLWPRQVLDAHENGPTCAPQE
jgi:hypothetical protein